MLEPARRRAWRTRRTRSARPPASAPRCPCALAPAPDQDPHDLARRGLEVRAREPVDPRGLQPRLDLVARAVLGPHADEPDRQLLAVDARPERLRERAHDRRHPHVAVVVPPDPVAGVELALGGALVDRDPVDVVEPRDRLAVLLAAGHAEDLLHAGAGRAAPRTASAPAAPSRSPGACAVSRCGRRQPRGAEVLRHGHGDRPAGRHVGLAATGGDDDDEEQKGAFHREWYTTRDAHDGKPDTHLHPPRRRRRDPSGRHEPGREDPPADRGLRHDRRAQRPHRRRARRRPACRYTRLADADPERPVRRRRGHLASPRAARSSACA